MNYLFLFTNKNDDEEFQIEFGMQSSGTRVYFRLARLLIELGNQEFTQDIQHASTPWIQSQLISGERSDLF